VRSEGPRYRLSMSDRPFVAAVGAASRMKPAAALTGAPVPQRRGLSLRPGGVGLIAALLLLAAPLAVAAWGLGNHAAQRERNDADAALTAGLDSASGVYRSALLNVDSAAARLAGDRHVQRRLLRGRRHVLVWRLQVDNEHPNGLAVPQPG